MDVDRVEPLKYTLKHVSNRDTVTSIAKGSSQEKHARDRFHADDSGTPKLQFAPLRAPKLVFFSSFFLLFFGS